MSGLTEKDVPNPAMVNTLYVMRTPTMGALKKWAGHEHVQVIQGLHGYAGKLVKVTQKYAHIDQPKLRGVEKFPLDSCSFVIHWTEEEKRRGWAARPNPAFSNETLGTESPEHWTCLSCYQRLPHDFQDHGDLVHQAHAADGHDINLAPAPAGDWDKASVNMIEPGWWLLTVHSKKFTIERQATVNGPLYSLWRGHHKRLSPRNYREQHVTGTTSLDQAILGAHIEADHPGLIKANDYYRLPDQWNKLAAMVAVTLYFRKHGLTEEPGAEYANWAITGYDPHDDRPDGWALHANGTRFLAAVHVVRDLGEEEENLLSLVITDITKSGR